MNRANAILTATLIALPFLLLPAAVLFAVAAPGRLSANETAQVARCSLRAIYIGGAILGWLAGRPIWFYPWLGFAVYEAVAILMLLVFSFVPEGYSLIVEIIFDFLTLGLFPETERNVPTFLRVFLFSLVFSPYFAAVLWLGWERSQRPLAVYAVFPLAALAPFLFLAIQIGPVSIDDAFVLVPPAVASAIVAVFYWRPPSGVARHLEDGDRVGVLYVGVPFVQLSLLLDYIFRDEVFDISGAFFFLIFLPTYIGWLILSGSLLLPFLLQQLRLALKTKWVSARPY